MAGFEQMRKFASRITRRNAWFISLITIKLNCSIKIGISTFYGQKVTESTCKINRSLSFKMFLIASVMRVSQILFLLSSM